MKKVTNKHFLLLISTLLLGTFLRLFKIADYLTFLGDEGRDVLIVRRLLVNFDPILIGPGTSIGNMYLGPWYYYLIAPFLLFFNFSPVGPAIFIAFIGVLTILLIYFVTREWFGKSGALVASFLYAISPTIIIYSRSSWNPNIMPFFALLSIYSIWQIWEKWNFKWFLGLGIFLAMVLNSHYLGLLLIPVLSIFGFITIYELYKSGLNKYKEFFGFAFGGLMIFLFLMSPLVIFDARHGWNNFGAMFEFFSKRETTVSIKPWKAIPDIWPLWQIISSRLVAGRNEILGGWMALVMAASSLWLFGSKKFNIQKSEIKSLFLIFCWLLISLLGLGLYKQHVYDHYFGFFYPAPFILLGAIAQNFLEKYKIRGLWLVLVGVIILTYFNFKENPLKYEPNRQLERTKKIAELVIEKADGKEFNFAIIADRNYEDAYQYFLEKNNSKIVEIDPLNSKETIKDQLFVVCEKQAIDCDPTHNSKAEIANFGWSNIAEEWQYEWITIYKLVHSQ